MYKYLSFVSPLIFLVQINVIPGLPMWYILAAVMDILWTINIFAFIKEIINGSFVQMKHLLN